MKKDDVKKLRLCPFCGSDHTDDWTWISKVESHNQYMLIHYCRSDPTGYDRVITVYGPTLEECIERWNSDGKHTAD